jgi:hypothetical protein
MRVFLHLKVMFQALARFNQGLHTCKVSTDLSDEKPTKIRLNCNEKEAHTWLFPLAKKETLAGNRPM